MPVKLPPEWHLISLRETESTNEEAKRLPPGSHKTAVRADMQTGGRGRMGRRWVSPIGNLYISFCLELGNLQKAGFYSFISAVALADAIETLCPKVVIQCKWPNDLLIKGCKISGILLETDGVGRLIVGIGVNLIAPPQGQMLYPVTALLSQGYEIEVDTMAEALIKSFDRWGKCFETQGAQPVLDEWLKKAYGLGGLITVNLPDKRLEGIFSGLDKDGCLLLNKENEIIKITAGDVFFGTTGKK